MSAATALFTTTVADAIVNGYRGSPGAPSVVWPAVLRNAAIVAVLGLGTTGNQQRPIVSFLGIMGSVAALRSVQQEKTHTRAIRETGIDAVVVAAGFMVVPPLIALADRASRALLGGTMMPVPALAGMGDNAKLLLAMALLYNNARGSVGGALKHLGLTGLKNGQAAALGAAVAALALAA